VENKKYTVEDLEAHCKRIADQREIVAEKKRIYSEANDVLEALEQDALQMLISVGKQSYKSEYGTVGIIEKWRVNLPDSPEGMEQLLNHFKERGLFGAYATVNSNKLNSYYMEEWEQVKQTRDPDQIMNFKIPGVGEPKLFKTTSFRKK
jgi:hypothetical protein